MQILDPGSLSTVAIVHLSRPLSTVKIFHQYKTWTQVPNRTYNVSSMQTLDTGLHSIVIRVLLSTVTIQHWYKNLDYGPHSTVAIHHWCKFWTNTYFHIYNLSSIQTLDPGSPSTLRILHPWESIQSWKKKRNMLTYLLLPSRHPLPVYALPIPPQWPLKLSHQLPWGLCHSVLNESSPSANDPASSWPCYVRSKMSVTIRRSAAVSWEPETEAWWTACSELFCPFV